MPEKQPKKSALKKFLVSYYVFTIFTSVEHTEIPCERKKYNSYHVYIINLLIIYVLFVLNYALK